MSDKNQDVTATIVARVQERLEIYRHRRHVQTDKLFAMVFLVQWVAAFVVAITLSPRAWEGHVSTVHMHVWFALILGGLIASAPIALAIKRPGDRMTRHIVAVAQMCFSALLIHLLGGRIETHFHVFGSLAILAFYLDPGVLIVAAVTIALDHILRGAYWPESVYGIVDPSRWRFLEHGFWVVLEVVPLIWFGRESLRAQKAIAEDFAYLEAMAEGDGRSVLSQPVEKTGDEHGTV